jgi:hypothetical protein
MVVVVVSIVCACHYYYNIYAIHCCLNIIGVVVVLVCVTVDTNFTLMGMTAPHVKNSDADLSFDCWMILPWIGYNQCRANVVRTCW